MFRYLMLCVFAMVVCVSTQSEADTLVADDSNAVPALVPREDVNAIVESRIKELKEHDAFLSQELAQRIETIDTLRTQVAELEASNNSMQEEPRNHKYSIWQIVGGIVFGIILATLVGYVATTRKNLTPPL